MEGCILNHNDGCFWTDKIKYPVRERNRVGGENKGEFNNLLHGS